MSNFVLWLAQGFGVGGVPFAPGALGSPIGLLWFAAMLAVPTGFFYLGGLVLGIALSVKISGFAEKLLNEKDPGSIVLDEIVAVPICFVAWIAIQFHQHGIWPSAGAFFNRRTWPLTLGIFVAFRFFDVVKPWPIGRSQSLPGGWGVTADDVLAAVYVNLLVLMAFFVNAAWRV